MKHIIMVSFLVTSQLGLAQDCFPEIYEYTDSDGVIHFTDNLSKIPHKLRTKNTKFAVPDLKTIETKPESDDYEKFFKSKFSDPEEPKDPRLSTPENSLLLFKNGLINGNLNDIRTSVTVKYWKSVNGFSGISKAQLKKESAWIPDDYIINKVNHYYAIVEFKGGPIKMVNLYGNWKLFFDFY